MRLAAHTYTFRERPLVEALPILRELGFERVEVWLGHAGTDLDGAAEAVRSVGLEAVAVSAGVVAARDVEKAERAFALAEVLGAAVVVACATPDVVLSLAGRAPPAVTLCAENHWYLELARPSEMLGALTRAPGAGACLDTGHAILAGIRPDRFASSLGPRLRHVHLKDAAAPSRPILMLGRKIRRRLVTPPAAPFPGKGSLQVALTRRALEAVGFQGAVTLEHEGAHGEAALTRLAELWRETSST